MLKVLIRNKLIFGRGVIMGFFGMLEEIVKLPVSVAIDVTGVGFMKNIVNDEDLESQTIKNIEKLVDEMDD